MEPARAAKKEPVVTSHSQQLTAIAQGNERMEEDRFWQLMGLFEGDPYRCDDERYLRLQEELTRHPTDAIIGFEDRMAMLLYELDKKELAQVPPLDADELSSDGFLYARCAVVVAGRDAYKQVLADPMNFQRFTSVEAGHAESLLYVAEQAFIAATGEAWDYVSPFDYETGSNVEGWVGSW